MAAGDGGVVLAVSISSSVVRGAGGAIHPSDAIVAVASFDGGTTWGATSSEVLIVNEGTGPCDIRQPLNMGPPPWSGVDRPHVTRDATGPASTFWVEWAGGLDANEICLRRVRAAPAISCQNGGTCANGGCTCGGSVTSPEATVQVPTGRAPQDPQIGDVIVRASGGNLFVMFGERFSVSCGTQPMRWFLTVSSDDGASWSPRSTVLSAPSMNPCFGTLPLGATANAGNIFDFDVAPDGTLWAAFHDIQNNIQVLASTTAGASWTTSFPRLATGGAAVGQVGLAIDLDNNVAVTYYQQIAGSGMLDRRVVVREAVSGVVSFPAVLSSPFTPNLVAAAGSAGRIGEYQGVTGSDPNAFSDGNSFFAIWTETDPTNTNVYRIGGARFRVGP